MYDFIDEKTTVCPLCEKELRLGGSGLLGCIGCGVKYIKTPSINKSKKTKKKAKTKKRYTYKQISDTCKNCGSKAEPYYSYGYWLCPNCNVTRTRRETRTRKGI
jgi:ribosomal protein L37AE/L43A